MHEIVFGQTVVDMGDLAQVVDTSQTRAIGFAICRAIRYMDGNRSLKEIVDMVDADVENAGLDCLGPYLTGDLARFRSFELAAAINRMRTLKVRQLDPAT